MTTFIMHHLSFFSFVAFCLRLGPTVERRVRETGSLDENACNIYLMLHLTLPRRTY